MSKVFKTGTKRRIERFMSIIRTVPSTTEGNLDLHVAEDSKTLVRCMLSLKVFRVAASTAGVSARTGMLVHVRPKGVSVYAASITSTLDVPTGREEIARWITADTIKTAVGQYVSHVWEMDTKAMRKLAENDKITLSTLGSNSEHEVIGVVYLWFKE